MSYRRSRALALVIAAGGLASAASAQNTITTTFLNNNAGSAGGIVFFNIVTGASPLTITSVDVNTNAVATTTFGFTFYTHAGGYAGFEQMAAAWTTETTGMGTAAGVGLPSPVTFTSSVIIPANTTTGVALVLASSGQTSAAHAYTNGTGANQTYSNPDLTLNLGEAQNVPFTGAPFTPRVWNGTIHYTLGGTTGACCRSDGSCVQTTQTNCTATGGLYRGDNSPCATANCPQPPTGACCRFDGSCSVVTQAQCTSSGGTYRGDGTDCGTITCPSPPPVIFSNCNITTGTTTLSGVGGLPAGSQWSERARDETDPFSANTTAGFGGTGALRLADDFVVPAGGWNVGYVRILAYLTGATSPGVTAATLRIWNRPPNDPTAVVVFGDATTNRMAAVQFAPIYRCFSTVAPVTGCTGTGTAPDQTRHQQYVYITVNQFLPAGTYWVDYNYTGASFSPPSTQSDAIGRQCDPNNHNALQFNAAWVACTDVGQGCVPAPVDQDMYFEILGSAGGSTCYANCDASTTVPFLNVNDFVCFQGKFAAGDSYANCDLSTNPPVLNVNDFVCFQGKFAAGCSAP